MCSNIEDLIFKWDPFLRSVLFTYFYHNLMLN